MSLRLLRGLRGLEASISENMNFSDLFFLKNLGKELSLLLLLSGAGT